MNVSEENFNITFKQIFKTLDLLNQRTEDMRNLTLTLIELQKKQIQLLEARLPAPSDNTAGD